MPHITTCPKCGKMFEAQSEEHANSPARLCPHCWASLPVRTYAQAQREPTKAAVRRWMEDHEDGAETATHLAERAAYAFDRDRWLDDETHWVWDIAAEVFGTW
jgi:predicted  nucleic acid-binding Zn-ribbon protein